MPAYPRPIGPELFVNTESQGMQWEPAVTGLSNGGFVVSWSDGGGAGGDASGLGIKAQIYDASGTPVGSEFLVNTETASMQSDPAITGLANGGFVVSWTDNSQLGNDTSEYGIKAQIYDASGTPVGSEISVNTEILSRQTGPTIAALSNGGFAVSWTDHSAIEDSGGTSIKAQIFDASGASVGDEFLVNTETYLNQEQPAIAGLGNGGFVVSWQELHNDESWFDVKAQVYDVSGTAVGSEFVVNSSTAYFQGNVTITGLSNGSFVASWSDHAHDDDFIIYKKDIKAQIYSSSGTPVGTEFIVNTGMLDHGDVPTITGLSTGGFVVSWRDNVTAELNNTLTGIKAQVYDAYGTRVGGEVLVKLETEIGYIEPAIAGLSNGGFVVTWNDETGYREDSGRGYGIKAQIFEIANPPTTSPVTLAGIAEDSGARIITQAELLANAQDLDGDTLTVSNLLLTGRGSLIDNGDGTWTFTTAANDDGAVSFSYSISDGTDSIAGSATLDITPVNDAPTMTLTSQVTTTLAENAPTTTRTKIADFAFNDIDASSHQFLLTGADAALFEIGLAPRRSLRTDGSTGAVEVSSQSGTVIVYLKAGAVLDFEKNPSLDVTLNLDDPTLPGVQVARSLTIAITDVNEAPKAALTGKLTALAENASTTVARQVATIAISDDALGSETLTLSGADAAMFQIKGTALYLKAGAKLDFETNPKLDVTVNVDDPTLPGIEAELAMAIAVNNVNEAPQIALTDKLASLAENASAVVARKVADIVISDDALGNEVLTLSGADAALFQIKGSALYLKAGAKLDFETNSKLDVTVNVDDPTLPGIEAKLAMAIAVTNVNEAPQIALTGKLASLAESASTTVARKVADIVISDDALGNEVLTLSGADAALFQIKGGALYLKAGAKLDFTTNPKLDVTVNVDDKSIGNGIDAKASLSIAVRDVSSTIQGTNAANTLTGTSTADVINGLGGNDRIKGGGGVDILTGGTGADTFIFTRTSDSGSGFSGFPPGSTGFNAASGQGKRDIITDFAVGIDTIDLSAIDTSPTKTGDQVFSWKAGAAFSKKPGELTFKIFDVAGTTNDKTIIYGDIDGNGLADFQIELTGLKALTKGDFIL